METVGTVSAAKRKRLCREIEKWRQRLRLQEWEVMWKEVGRDEVGPVGGAQIDVDATYRKATVKVHDWREEDGMAFHARHELLHLVFTELRSVAFELAEGYSSEARDIWQKRYAELEEHAVTRLGRAFDELEHIGEKDETYC